ncbi:MAG: PEP/pyruvate-binding domain-containing protein [Dehalococcoidia bacterium]
MTDDTARALLPIILAFDDPLPAGIDAAVYLGGKGAGLLEMTQVLGLPVPPGFTITTDVCRRYLTRGWPADLDAALATHLDRLGARLGRGLGVPEAPLLVSVRSGAPVSMPGMMDTLLNVGITPAIRDAMAARHTPLFAADTWLRFCRMYAGIVLGIPAAEVAAAAASERTTDGMLAAADRVHTLAAGAGGIPADPLEQVRGAVAAVFRSWHSDRARAFRQREQIAESLGTAVTIQAMVFGNLGHRSGTGVAFTRNPATGDAGPFGDYLAGAQGEDVVGGTHAVDGLDALRAQAPAAYAELLDGLDRLERHARDMCDVEFTVSDGALFILQTRIGRRSPTAAVRIAVAMAEDPGFPLTRAEAVARIGPDIVQQVAGLTAVRPGIVPLATGMAASPGVGTGVLCCDPDRAAELAGRGVAVVLAREETSPGDIHGMIGAAGLVTTLGGVTSHAAVVARSWAIPTVTSVAETRVLATGIRTGDVFVAEGDVVTVDGTSGALYAGDQREHGAAVIAELQTLRGWAIELGVELGTIAVAPWDSGAADVSLFDLGRTVQLKGLCTAERAAVALSTTPVRIEALLTGNEPYFRVIPRGITLTPEGRRWIDEQLAAERTAIDAGVLEGCYESFAALNHRFKEVVSAWQTRAPSAPSDADWQALVRNVAAIHAQLLPILIQTAAQAPRLGSYSHRFDIAIAALRRGDRSMLASPLKDSYHTIWFEYHEELIALCGRDRNAEERQELEQRTR